MTSHFPHKYLLEWRSDLDINKPHERKKMQKHWLQEFLPPKYDFCEMCFFLTWHERVFVFPPFLVRCPPKGSYCMILLNNDQKVYSWKRPLSLCEPIPVSCPAGSSYTGLQVLYYSYAPHCTIACPVQSTRKHASRPRSDGTVRMPRS